MSEGYSSITPDMFLFADGAEYIGEGSFNGAPKGYLADAFMRFRKNRSSVAAAFIIAFLVLFSLLSPIISPYTVFDKDNVYANCPPFSPGVARFKIGVLDGARRYKSMNKKDIDRYRAIADETGYDPVVSEVKPYEVEEKNRGQTILKTYFTAKINSYYAVGARLLNISYSEFENIQKYQNETGIQVLLPYVDGVNSSNTNVWYKTDKSGGAIFDVNGDFISNYSTDLANIGPVEYNSKRIDGDDGSLVYSRHKSGSLNVRVAYYNYYRYLNGMEPTHYMGTDEYGRDLFDAIGTGARFSLLFALLVSAVNLTVGAVYGAIQGYYGGGVDLAMDRVTDILSGVPTIVVMTLFKLHLAEKIGVFPSVLFAFVLTGWIGMAALTRKQFYRYKSREYVMAARTLGASDKRLIFKHIFPNAIGTMVTSSALVIPGVISSETSLTYLGIINLSAVVGTSLGELMECGQRAMATAPHAMLFPALFLSLLLISFNLFGNGLRDAFNPSTRGAED